MDPGEEWEAHLGFSTCTQPREQLRQPFCSDGFGSLCFKTWTLRKNNYMSRIKDTLFTKEN